MMGRNFTLNGSRYYQEKTTGLVWYIGPDPTKQRNHEKV